MERGCQFVKKPLITKNEFIKYMTSLKNDMEFTDSLFELFNKFNVDGQPMISLVYDSAVEMLEKLMCSEIDNAGYSTISWWLYEKDCGKNDQIMWWKNEKIDLKTVEDVWNQCIRELGGEDNE